MNFDLSSPQKYDRFLIPSSNLYYVILVGKIILGHALASGERSNLSHPCKSSFPKPILRRSFTNFISSC
jgi:hypothetical protein